MLLVAYSISLPQNCQVCPKVERLIQSLMKTLTIFVEIIQRPPTRDEVGSEVANIST